MDQQLELLQNDVLEIDSHILYITAHVIKDAPKPMFYTQLSKKYTITKKSALVTKKNTHI